jgi:hypothetical protein
VEDGDPESQAEIDLDEEALERTDREPVEGSKTVMMRQKIDGSS